MLVETTVEGLGLTAVSYRAPPGVNWGIVKPCQAVTVARWLAAQKGPVLLGADANPPLIDAADFANTRTHWHSGDRRLNGEPGDDLLFAQARFTRSRTVSSAGSLTIPHRQPDDWPVARATPAAQPRS